MQKLTPQFRAMPCLAFAPSAHFLSSCFSHSFAQPIHAINSSRDKNSRHNFANIACLIYALSAQFDERPNFLRSLFFCEKFSHSSAQVIFTLKIRQAKTHAAIPHARLFGKACFARKNGWGYTPHPNKKSGDASHASPDSINK